MIAFISPHTSTEILSVVAVLCACQDLPANISVDPAEWILSRDLLQMLRELSMPAHKASGMQQTQGRLAKI